MTNPNGRPVRARCAGSLSLEKRCQLEFGKLGERAVQMALVCREAGLRDLVVPWADVPEAIPLLSEFVQARRYCSSSAWGKSTCSAEAVVLIVTGSGFKGGYCEACAEKYVVRMPAGQVASRKSQGAR